MKPVVAWIKLMLSAFWLIWLLAGALWGAVLYRENHYVLCAWAVSAIVSLTGVWVFADEVARAISSWLDELDAPEPRG